MIIAEIPWNIVVYSFRAISPTPNHNKATLSVWVSTNRLSYTTLFLHYELQLQLQLGWPGTYYLIDTRLQYLVKLNVLIRIMRYNQKVQNNH